MNKIEKHAGFFQIGKISIQLGNEYYENGKNAEIQKIYENFH